jgi:fructosamine-3-kinase
MHALFGSDPVSAKMLGEGIIHLRLEDGFECVYKHSNHALVEAKMLTVLRDHLPCATVYDADESALVMEYVVPECPIDEAEAGRTLAKMHRHRFGTFGFEYDTTIGPYCQVNTPNRSWPEFFAAHRLMAMAQACHEEGKLPAGLMRRIETLAQMMGDYLREPPHASLLHGDIWSGNVIGRRAGATYIDPAVYRGDHEMELAFILLFNTFSQRFFSAYSEVMPIDRDFFGRRKDILNLYPLLVHVRSFGGSYLQGVESALARAGV